MACLGASAFWNPPQRNDDHCGCEWQIDEKYPAPRSVLYQPSPQHRTNRSGNRGKARPCADCLAAALFVKRYADNRKTAGHEKSRSNALNTPRHDQLMDVRGNTASGRSNGKNHYTQDEYETAAEQVAERAAD